jgi:hypothetical protein
MYAIVGITRPRPRLVATSLFAVVDDMPRDNDNVGGRCSNDGIDIDTLSSPSSVNQQSISASSLQHFSQHSRSFGWVGIS